MGGRTDSTRKRSIRFEKVDGTNDNAAIRRRPYETNISRLLHSIHSASQTINQSILHYLGKTNMRSANVSLFLTVSVAFFSELAVVAFIPSSIACGGNSGVRSSHHRHPCFGEKKTPISQHLHKICTQNPAVSSSSSLSVQSEVLVEAPSEGEEQEEEVQIEQLEGPLSGEEINARLERQLEKMRLKDQTSKQLLKEVRVVKPRFIR